MEFSAGGTDMVGREQGLLKNGGIGMERSGQGVDHRTRTGYLRGGAGPALGRLREHDLSEREKAREPKYFFEFGEWAIMEKHLERLIRQGRVAHEQGRYVRRRD